MTSQRTRPTPAPLTPPDLLSRLRALLSTVQARDLRSWHSRALTLAQVRALRYIADAGRASLGAISLHLNTLPSSASGIVERLARMGLVRRSQSRPDRRVVEVELTSAGVYALEGSQRDAAPAIERELARIPTDDRLAAARVIDRIRQAVRPTSV